MNIDERIEALTQSVELLASMHMDLVKLLKKHIEAAEERERAPAERYLVRAERDGENKLERANAQRFAVLMETRNRMDAIIAIHKDRP